MSTSYSIDVRDGKGDWGTFFVQERRPVIRSGGYLRYSASFACNSSFGAYGYYWHDMGEPFVAFAAGIDADYLLGKIARRVTDDKLIVAGVKREIIERRRNRSITADEASAAFERVNEIAAEHSGEVLCHELYNDSEIGECKLDWDHSTQTWATDAQMFVKKLWPVFVRNLQLRADRDRRLLTCHHRLARMKSR